MYCQYETDRVAVLRHQKASRGDVYKRQAVVGAAAGILFAPESGEDTRSKIADALRKRGIKLSRTDMENLVDEIAVSYTHLDVYKRQGQTFFPSVFCYCPYILSCTKVTFGKT